MLIVLDTDGIVNLYASAADAEYHLEALDFEFNEYEICDERGQRFVGNLLSPTTGRPDGTFRLEPEGWPTRAVLASILGRAKVLDHPLGNYRSLDDLRRLVEGS